MELFTRNMLDCVAIIILILVLIYSKTQFSKDYEGNKLFNVLVVSLLVFTILNFLVTYTIEYAEYVPVWLNYFNSTGYFPAEGVAIVVFYKYVENYLNASKNRTVAYIVRSYFPALFAIESLGINCFVCLIFEFGKYGYCCYGPLFPMLYVILIYYQILILVMLIHNRRRISKRKLRAVLSFMITTLLMIAIQLLLLPDVSLQPFGFAIATLILMLTLETPDYQKLTSTLKSLEAVREQANKLSYLKTFFIDDKNNLETAEE